MAVVTPGQLLVAVAEKGSVASAAVSLGIDEGQAKALLLGAAKALAAQAPPAAAVGLAPRRSGAGALASAPGGQAGGAPSAGSAVRGGGSAGAPSAGSAVRGRGSASAPSAGSSAKSGSAGAPSAGSAAKSSEAVAASAASAGALPRKAVVYSDGASRGNPGPAGAGAVIADPSGRILRRLGRYLGAQTNNFAEYQGALLGLESALDGGVREVLLRADSELLIRQLEGRYQVKSAGIKPLFAAAQQLLRRFEKVTLEHVPRAQNADADEMSNRAIDEKL
jgi:ribonuclease HI